MALRGAGCGVGGQSLREVPAGGTEIAGRGTYRGGGQHSGPLRARGVFWRWGLQW